MRSASVCTSIEGEKIYIECRKFTIQPPRRESGKCFYPFKISIHGEATVKQVYDGEGQLKSKRSFWAEGDEIHGEAIDGYAGKPIKNNNIEVVNKTHTHKAQAITIRGGAYAHVEIGVRDHLASVKQIDNKA